MPAIVAWILGGLGWALSSAVGRFFAAAGLAFAVYTFAVGPWITDIAQYFGALPEFVASMFGWFGVDKTITIVMSAYGIKWAGSRISGLTRRGGAMAGAVGIVW